MVPGDLKGLTKQQVKDLKKGKGSPKHLIEKYSVQEHFSRIKSNHPERHTAVKSDASSLSFGLAPCKSSIDCVHRNSPPNKASPRFGKKGFQDSLDASSTKSPSLTNVLNFVNSLNKEKAGLPSGDCVTYLTEDKEEDLNLSRKGSCALFIEDTNQMPKFDNSCSNRRDKEDRSEENPLTEENLKTFQSNAKTGNEMTVNCSRQNWCGVDKNKLNQK